MTMRNDDVAGLTVGVALKRGAAALRGHACARNDAEREARDLLAHVLETDDAGLISAEHDRLSDEDAARYAKVVRRRMRHEPLAIILGSAWFMGREFRVTPDTLIPRPATEHLVESALRAAERIEARHLIDVGTGSGIIAVSLSLGCPDATVWATDTSAAALKVAGTNADLNDARGIKFERGDLLEPIPKNAFSRPTVTVANLPYIPEDDWHRLIPDIRDFEPRTALVAGPDGLDAYRRLIEQIRKRNPAVFAVVMEILPKQEKPLSDLALMAWPDAEIRAIRNLAGDTVGISVVRMS
jgi:release factor glutamine methyltransferase